MVTLTFPDGAAREYEAGTTAMQVAKKISKGLAKKVLAAKLDGTLVDASLPIEADAKIELVTAEDPEGLELANHAAFSNAFSNAATAASNAKSVDICRAGYLATPDKTASFANRPAGVAPPSFNIARRLSRAEVNDSKLAPIMDCFKIAALACPNAQACTRIAHRETTPPSVFKSISSHDPQSLETFRAVPSGDGKVAFSNVEESVRMSVL